MRGQTVETQCQESDEDMLARLPGDGRGNRDLEHSAWKEVDRCGVQAVKKVRLCPCVDDGGQVDRACCDEVIPTIFRQFDPKNDIKSQDGPGTESEVAVDEEENHEQDRYDDVREFEEFIIAVSIRKCQHSATDHEGVSIPYRIHGRDINVKYAWGMRVATPVQ